MSRTPTTPTEDMCNAVDHVEQEHEKDLEKFEAAVEVIKNTKSTNPKIVLAKKALYKATTVAEFMAATDLFRGTTTGNDRIKLAKKMLFAAAKKCSQAHDDVRACEHAMQPDGGSAASVAVGSAAPAPVETHEVLPAPAGAAEPAFGPSCVVVMSPAMRESCGFGGFCMNPRPPAAAPARDVTRALLSAPAAEPAVEQSRLGASRVLVAAPAFARAPPKPSAAAVFTGAAFRDGVNFFRSLCSTKPAESAPLLAEQPAAAGQKRPVFIDLCGSSDDEDKPLKPEPKKPNTAGAGGKAPKSPDDDEKPLKATPKKPSAAGGVAQASNGAGKAAMSPQDQVTEACRIAGRKRSDDKVVYAADYAGQWTDRVIDLMHKLTRHGLYDWKQMNGYAHDELRTLPEEVALECLQEFLKEENHIEDPNKFLIDHAVQLRTVYDLESANDVYAKLMNEHEPDDRTESDEPGPAGGSGP
jgi:hypothetical protein